MPEMPVHEKNEKAPTVHGREPKKESLTFEKKSPFRIRGWRPITILFFGGHEHPIVACLKAG